jgi:hypothetical protein
MPECASTQRTWFPLHPNLRIAIHFCQQILRSTRHALGSLASLYN